MKNYNTPEIAKNVYAVGAKDWNLRIFDAFMPTPKGSSYNSYLVKGSDKTALIDTVGPGFENELAAKLAQLTDLSKLDYVIMNHAEPDHATAIPLMMQSSKATLITSEKGAGLANRFHNVPLERIRTVKEGDTVDLGGKTLRFIEAPWLHWPETMFTYLVDDRILFPCDFFGAHVAHGTFEDDVDDLLPFAKSYFGEIMMPFRSFGKKAMDKLAGLDIAMIAPSHGPVYKNPARIMEPYRQWVDGETKPKAIVAYVSMWNSTETMAKIMVEALSSNGVEVKPYNLVRDSFDYLAADLVDSRAIIIGTPTVLSNMHPAASYAASVIKLLKPPLKYGAVLNSYGWGKGVVKAATEFFESAKIETVGAVEINGHPLEADNQKIIELGKQLAEKILANS
jgi:flavorubredoxin